ncbi:hypothetical protein C5Y93_09815 [Blastopirellula marina]|uniref:Leucine Rich repeats (2 copies) n=2 Tax=Blastopirellula marina TaxID=124 RepID=A0A2S8GP99_9BACT|nr:hypothetical protein C5Y93_09815 [Blastopirellula marina]
MGDPPTSPVQRKRRWLSFSVRGLLLLILIVSVGLGFLARDLYQFRQRQAVVRRIEANGGSVNLPFYEIGDPFETSNRSDVRLSEEQRRTLYQQWVIWFADEDIYKRPWGASIAHADDEPLFLGLEYFPELFQLTIGPGTLSDASMESICRLKSLQQIRLHETQMTKQQVGRLASLPELTEIEFHGAATTPEALSQLGHIPRLETVRLIADQVPVEALAAIRSIPIHRLAIVVNTTTIPNLDQPDPLDGITQLSSLELTNYPVSDNTLAAIGKMQSLWSLGIDCPAKSATVSNEGLERLTDISSLTYLSLPTLKIDDEGLEILGRLKSLQKLSCDGSLITDAGLKHLTQVSQLSIPGCQATLAVIRELNKRGKLASLDAGAGMSIRFTQLNSPYQLSEDVPYIVDE